MAKVLYIEDNLPNVIVVSRIAESLNLELIVTDNATNGFQALEDHHPDLVLMDVGLPDIDGLTATRMIRENQHHQDLPIIAITASAMVGDRERCLEAGCNDYIAKPFQVKDLIDILNRWLKEDTAK